MSQKELANLTPAEAAPVMTVQSSMSEIMADDAVLDRIDRIADRMAKSKSTLPSHLAGNVGDCWAVCMQAFQWGMNPWAVGQKTFLVSGTLGYEAQLVNAVVTSLAPVTGRLDFEWFGDWGKILGKIRTEKGKNGSYMVSDWAPADEQGLGVKVWATLKGEDQPRVLELLLVQAQVRNSTLWAADPRQQLAYLGIKRWARLYCPDVLLGVYTPDELSAAPAERDITPPKPAAGGDGSAQSSLKEKLKEKAGAVVDGEATEVIEPAEEEPSAPGVLTYAQVAGVIRECQSEQELQNFGNGKLAAWLGLDENANFTDEIRGLYRNKLSVFREEAAAAAAAEEPKKG